MNAISGSDTITVSPLLTMHSYVFGGTGNDTITGGSGSSVLVGGTGNDVLTGNSGADVLIGGTGTDTFHDAGTGGDGNLIIPNYYSQEYNLPALESLLTTWTTSGPGAARTAAVESLLASAVRSSGNLESIYESSANDLIVAAPNTPEQVWATIPGVMVVTPTSAIYLVNSLSDVVVTATSAQVVTGGSANPAGGTLVVNGTENGDSIVLQPSATLANGVYVLVNGVEPLPGRRRSPISSWMVARATTPSPSARS